MAAISFAEGSSSPQSLFLLRQIYFYTLSNFTAHVLGLLFFYIAWSFAKRVKLVLQFVAYRLGYARIPLFNKRPVKTSPPLSNKYHHILLLGILVLISLIAGEADIALNSTALYGTFINSIDQIREDVYAPVIYNGSSYMSNVSLSKAALAFSMQGDGGSSNQQNGKHFEIHCSASCSLNDCMSSLYFDHLLDANDIAYNALVPNPGYFPTINPDGSILSYSINNISFQNQKGFGSNVYATNAGHGKNTSMALMLQTSIHNDSTPGNILFSMPFITERKPYPVDLIYHDYVGNAVASVGFVRYAIMQNDWDQLQPLTPTIAPLNGKSLFRNCTAY